MARQQRPRDRDEGGASGAPPLRDTAPRCQPATRNSCQTGTSKAASSGAGAPALEPASSHAAETEIAQLRRRNRKCAAAQRNRDCAVSQALPPLRRGELATAVAPRRSATAIAPWRTRNHNCAASQRNRHCAATQALVVPCYHNHRPQDSRPVSASESTFVSYGLWLPVPQCSPSVSLPAVRQCCLRLSAHVLAVLPAVLELFP